VGTVLSFVIAVKEEGIIGDGFFDQLLEEEQLGTIDDRVDALLKSLHRGKRLERIAKENDCGCAALTHGHALEGLQGEILADVIGGEEFLDNNYLVPDLAESDQEVAVSRRGVDFIAQLGQGCFGGIEPFRGGESQQGGLVGGADEIEFVRHRLDYLSLRAAGMAGGGGAPALDS